MKEKIADGRGAIRLQNILLILIKTVMFLSQDKPIPSIYKEMLFCFLISSY
jgi:hypothetical protein